MTTPFPGEIESRMGIEPLDVLLAQRDTLVKQAAALRAEHGPGGVWDDRRRMLRATIYMRLRTEAVRDSQKVTEAYLEEASHADRMYDTFIVAGAVEKAKWFELENQIQSIQDQINRGQAIARFVSQELGLTPR